jgi:hypothetical protein
MKNFLLRFRVGHQVEGGRLRTADTDRLDEGRRQSEETVTPVDP